MYPLALTMVFLTLLSILTTSELKSFGTSQVEKLLHKSSIQSKQSLQQAQEMAHFINCKQEHSPAMGSAKDSEMIDDEPRETEPVEKKSSAKKPVPLNVNLDRPPNKARLNAALLLSGHTSDLLLDRHQPYELFARLLRKLYGEHPFFQGLSNFEYQILDRLIASKEKAQKFTTPDELATISFDDSKLQEAFYMMLKGSSAQGPNHPSFPSLLFFITFDTPQGQQPWRITDHKVNLLFAPPEILEIIFENSTITDSLLTYRNKQWKEILLQEENRLKMTQEEGTTRTAIKEKLNSFFTETLSRNGLDPANYKPLFDFSLGQFGSVLLIQDKKTGLSLREKLSS